ncbi:MAG TPA: hypothetical protein VH417_10235 [Vicinamibacterales bacterium]
MPRDAPPAKVRARSAVALLLTAIVLAALAFGRNEAMVSDLEWPGLDTQYRELAAAQTMLDEGYGPDSAYRQERVWYNPMAPWVISGLTRLTGAAPRTIVARSGPWINLLAPAALFLIIALVFDLVTAVAGTAAFVFIIGAAFPFYYAATYSPWFGPENFGQALFYLGLLVALTAFEREFAIGRALVLGVALGLTFLTHTAPALVLGCCMVALAFWQGRTSGRWRDAAGTLFGALAVAFAVSLPFGIQILFHYRLKVVNAFPGLSPSDFLDLNELPHVIRATATLPALAGVVALVWRLGRRPSDRGTRLVLVWGGVVSVFLAAHVVAMLAERAGLNVPAIVPAFHFFYYLMPLVALGFGLAVRDLSALAIGWIGRRRGRWAVAANDWRSAVGAALATALIVGLYFPQYLRRPDFHEMRDRAARMNREMPAAAYDWIRTQTDPQAVFLCSDDLSLYVVSPAGRKVVATNRYFSSPYVAWEQRDRDRAEMFGRLAAGDLAGFRALAERYQVAYLMLPEQAPSDFWLRVSGMVRADVPRLRAGDLAAQPGFDLAFRGAGVAIVAVRYPPG